MLENLFIAYGNHSLRDDPQNFWKILDEIAYGDIALERHPALGPEEAKSPLDNIDEDCFRYEEPCGKSYLDSFVRNILDFGADLNEATLRLGHLRAQDLLLSKVGSSFAMRLGERPFLELSKKERTMIGSSPDKEVAFEAVFGYRDSYCHFESSAFIESLMKKFDCTRDRAIEIIREEGGECSKFLPAGQGFYLLDRELFRGPERIKCYECEQLYFMKLLDQIIEGKELGEIIGLFDFLNARGKATTYDVVFSRTKPGALFKQELDTQRKWRNPLGEYIIFASGPDKDHPYKHIFNDFFRSIITFSLAEFLLNNDRRKLKKCPFCSDLYIANDIRQKVCKSVGCRRAYNRERKRKQREDDPVKYY